MSSFTTNCVQCGKSYQAQRKTSKFCSDKCRQNHKRKHTNDVNVFVEFDKVLASLKRLEKLPADELMKYAWMTEEVRKNVKLIDEKLETHLDSIFGTNRA